VAAFRRINAAAAAVEPPPVSQEEWETMWAGVVKRAAAAPRRAVPEPETAGWRQRLGGVRWLAAAAVLAAAIGLGSYVGLRPRARRPEARGEPCVVEYLEAAEGYVSVYTHSEEADLTLITVVPAEERQEPRP
jgi:hypothetical protein